MQANVQEPSSHSAFLSHRSQQTGAQAVEVARFTVLNYIKSGWILFDGVLLFFVYMAFLYYPIMEASQFFGVALPAMALDAFVSSAILLHRTFKANFYMQLSHLPSRSASLYGLMLATCVLRVLLYLCFYLLTLLMHMDAGIGMTTQIFWVGSLATVLIAIFCSLLMVTLLQPIARRTHADRFSRLVGVYAHCKYDCKYSSALGLAVCAVPSVSHQVVLSILLSGNY